LRRCHAPPAVGPHLAPRNNADRFSETLRARQSRPSGQGALHRQLQLPGLAGVIATRPEQIEQNVKAIGWKLSAEEMTEIDRITKG